MKNAILRLVGQKVRTLGGSFHNWQVRPYFVPGILGIALVAVVSTSCDPGTHSTPAIDKKVLGSDSQGAAHSVPMPVPKTTEDVAKLGIPVFPGSVLADEADSTTLEIKTDIRTYKVKMYAPKDSATVIAAYASGIRNSTISGAADLQKVTGRTAKGDEIEVMLGPAADHSKTLVMVWLTQKN